MGDNRDRGMDRMNRPASIVRFEQLYLGCWILGLINLALSWNTQIAALHNNPAAVQMGEGFMQGAMIGGAVLTSLVTLLLWYFAARRGSAVAKWIITVLAGLGVIGFLFSFVTPAPVPILTRVLGLLVLVLQVAAVVHLFRPDTKAWFGETPIGPTPTDTL